MKLRRIRLENVRRFVDPVEIGPLGDGVSLLCEPNEAGKSTLFDALHALFFQQYKSFGKELQALLPQAGGRSLAVECVLEIDGLPFRLRKQWQRGGGKAQLWRDGALLHQDEAVEDWLRARMSGALGGPGGLLWVRQGRVRVDVDKRDKGLAAEETAARRDLLTAVSGALDDVTGGERMDRALRVVGEDLGRLETATGKAKAGGAWAAAEAELAGWEAREADLRGEVETFRAELDEMQRVRKALARLEDPEAEAARRVDLAQATEAWEAARRHADRVDMAAGAERMARHARDAAREALVRAEAAREATKVAEVAEGLALEADDSARDGAERAGRALAEAEAAAKADREAARQAEELLRAVRRHAEAEAAAERRARLSEQIARAQAAEAARIAAAGRAGRGPDDRTVARIEELLRARDRQQSMRDAAAPSVTFEGEGAVTLGGAALVPGRAVPLPAGGEIGLPGLGRLRVSVPGASGAALDAAERALREALDAGGWAEMAALRAAAQDRAAALAEAEAQRRTREALAPEGIPALQEALAALPEVVPETDDLPDAGEAEAQAGAARAQADRSAEAAAEAAKAAEAARIAAAEAAADLRAARERRATALRSLEALPQEAPDLSALASALAEAEAAHAALRAEAPDLDALAARRDRLTAVDAQTRREIGTLREARARLRERIERGSDEGLEERLAEAETRLGEARAALDRVLFERDTLRRLRDALEAARAEAREAYFGPVARELAPLLADLWEEAELDWSEDTLLPTALRRRGTTEPLDILSGGTQEQIAFLVRLAFARLLARAGRPAPLILDDALVYSDDDRIEKMFNALHRAAGDLQIVVLSCRQRAFSELGAPQLRFEPV
ncbi:AAA family ATPase [Jannaschia formosa]|uniref:AAA family ATPase n=1 Tax=Jannaschia formosa TaxID=2259592 RepID=UPI000E1C3193|nr:ATP-binding protein [Jannaschia formosa]TFL16771.1 chromosome segregation protein SMC [Jannaschia formosa]